MTDFYTAEQLVVSLGLTSSQISDLVAQCLLQPVTKNGRQFHSAREVYRLKAAIKLSRKRKIALEDAFAQVAARPLYQVESSPR